jgi:hypothetical protein
MDRDDLLLRAIAEGATTSAALAVPWSYKTDRVSARKWGRIGRACSVELGPGRADLIRGTSVYEQRQEL